jgi:hypothetical protein
MGSYVVRLSDFAAAADDAQLTTTRMTTKTKRLPCSPASRTINKEHAREDEGLQDNVAWFGRTDIIFIL